jgi:hypothetical protein
MIWALLLFFSARCLILNLLTEMSAASELERKATRQMQIIMAIKPLRSAATPMGMLSIS